MKTTARYRALRKSARRLCLVAGACTLLAHTALADAAAGRQAFEKGDYERAVTEWQSSADHGDAESQFGLGTIYEQGVGDLKQDYKRADYWYRKAAEQGNTEALYRLGLIWAAGSDGFPNDLVEAYKWAVLAGKTKGVWGSAAADLIEQLNKVLTARERKAGKERAAAWNDARTAKMEAPPASALAPAVSPAPAVASAPSAAAKPANGGCPGWPFPTLPCTEQFPALSGAQAGPVAAGTAAALPPRTATAKTPVDELADALKQIDCASLKVRDVEGLPTVAGTVPGLDQKEKIVQAAARWFPDRRPEVSVEIVPPPLCRVLTEFDSIRAAGLVADGNLALHLKNNGTTLRQGDPIELSVQAPAYPVHLRIDYFSLDGQVLHLAPSNGEPAPQLAAKSTRVFGRSNNRKDWIAGGAPFGTELIAVIATSSPINAGAARSDSEPATKYLQDLRAALGHATAGSAARNVLGTLLVHTSGH